MKNVELVTKGEKLQIGSIYNVVYSKDDMIKLLVVSEYPNMYLCDHATPFGEHYSVCINKNDITSLGEKGTIQRIEKLSYR